MKQSILSEGELSEHKGFRHLEIEEFYSDEIQDVWRGRCHSKLQKYKAQLNILLFKWFKPALAVLFFRPHGGNATSAHHNTDILSPYKVERVSKQVRITQPADT